MDLSDVDCNDSCGYEDVESSQRVHLDGPRQMAGVVVIESSIVFLFVFFVTKQTKGSYFTILKIPSHERFKGTWFALVINHLFIGIFEQFDIFMLVVGERGGLVYIIFVIIFVLVVVVVILW